MPVRSNRHDGGRVSPGSRWSKGGTRYPHLHERRACGGRGAWATESTSSCWCTMIHLSNKLLYFGAQVTPMEAVL